MGLFLFYLIATVSSPCKSLKNLNCFFICIEAVVAESVVVIKKLLQTQPSQHQEIITQMARLMDHITVPQARASILWLLGEYSERVPKIAPDVLRSLAKTFTNEVCIQLSLYLKPLTIFFRKTLLKCKS